jgi:hypothetical protein
MPTYIDQIIAAVKAGDVSTAEVLFNDALKDAKRQGRKQGAAWVLRDSVDIVNKEFGVIDLIATDWLIERAEKIECEKIEVPGENGN